jgi:endonuclease YncB( thermonuclease family)
MASVVPFRRLRHVPPGRLSTPSFLRQRRASFGRLARHLGFIILAALMFGAAVLLNVNWPASAPHAMTNVIAVDGDTLRASGGRIRLYGIDAPEYDQTCRDGDGRSWSCGRAAKTRLASLVALGNVACAPQGHDRYGRTLAICSAVDVEDIADVLVREGYAVDYRRYSLRYSAAALAARIAKRGIWNGTFEQPEAFRHRRH